jgi:tRNA-2-methylthio-N6-dimethylallyladenosine synthase
VRFQVLTFGCQMNVHDSVWLSRALKARGFEEVPPDGDPNLVDVFVVNTCSVREKPEQKVYSTLGRLKPFFDKDRRVFAAVGGCVAQQVGRGFFERFEHVRLVFGTDGTAMAPQAIERLAAEPGLRLSLLDFTEEYQERDPALPEHGNNGLGGQAFVTIMQGCDNYCAYCIVPHVRGRQKSRAGKSVLRECEQLVDRGVREITLLGQNVNAFGLDAGGDGTGFAELLGRVASIPGLKRLRFTTSHPKDIADEVVAAFGEHPALCPQLHLPLQSGSDRMLAAMGRRYDTARYMEIVHKLRRARPDIALSTDLIVGFPGESEEDFQATLDAMRRAAFASSFSFQYSDRPGTRAQRLEPKIDPAVKADRLARLQALQEELTEHNLAGAVGERTEVLVEGESKKTTDGRATWRGRDPYRRVVNLIPPRDADRPTSGSLITVRIDAAKKHSLFGKAIGTPW